MRQSRHTGSATIGRRPPTLPSGIPANGVLMRDPLASCLPVWCLLAWCVLTPAAAAWARQPRKEQPATVCQFLGDTLVPRVAMGVRRIDGDTIDVLELRREPDRQAAIVVDVPLFRPFFVAASRTDAAGDRWHLLQDGYVAAAPLGWAPARHLHVLDSRYAYTFATRPRDRRAELMDVPKESYQRLLAQVRGDQEGGKEKIVVLERAGADAWRPVRIEDTVPFVELRIPPESRDREHPDTTPTFRFGIPAENRLLHMGAVCGGPVDAEKLARLKATVLVDKQLEMLFVVDETVSMLPFNQVVANFIRGAGRLAAGRPVPVKVAVCAYTDGPPDTRVTLGQFKVVKGPEDVRELADGVALLGKDLPPGEYANPPERMLEGLRDALKKSDFQRGGTPFVAVVGDTGHEPADPDRKKLIAEVANLVKRQDARVYFMHVGRRQTPDELLFQKDFAAVQQEAAKLGVPPEKIVYERAEASDLEQVLEKARNEVEDERRRVQREIARMESRTPYTEPGPKLLEALAARGIGRAKFDEQCLQYFVPSQGWLFHPSATDAGRAKPQFRELFLLAPPERAAVRRLFDDIRDRLSRGEQIAGDDVIRSFATELSRAAGNAALAARVTGAWQRLPERQRSVGVFLEDVFGLRLKAALPFPAIAYRKDRPATAQEITRMVERIGRLGEAFRDQGDEAVWFDASELVP